MKHPVSKKNTTLFMRYSQLCSDEPVFKTKAKSELEVGKAKLMLQYCYRTMMVNSGEAEAP